MLTQTKTGILTLALVASFGCYSTASAENLINLYEKALTSDPQFLSSRSKAASGQEGIAQARATLLPSLSATISTSNSDTTSSGIQVFNGQAFPGVETVNDDDTDRLSISLDQEIYHHDSWIALSQAQKRARQANMSHEVEQQTLIIRVAEVYFNVLSSADNLEFAQAEKESVGKQLEQTKQRFDVGLIAQTDVHEAQAQYDQAIASEISAQNDLDNAYEALREITGSYTEKLSRLKESIPLETPQPANITDWEKVAERSNISLRSNQLAVEIARQEIKRQFANHYPTLDFSASYTDSSSEGNSSQTGTAAIPTGRESENTTLGLTLRIPLFSGGRTSSQVRQAQADYADASQELERVHRLTTKQTRSAYRGVVANISSIKALTQSQISNQSALEATKAGFDVGTRTMVDVLLSTTNLFNAKRTLARSRYDYVVNVLKLKQAAGILTQDDLAKVNSWLSL